jgi:hypothetical protein
LGTDLTTLAGQLTTLGNDLVTLGADITDLEDATAKIRNAANLLMSVVI